MVRIDILIQRKRQGVYYLEVDMSGELFGCITNSALVLCQWLQLRRSKATCTGKSPAFPHVQREVVKKHGYPKEAAPCPLL